MEAPAVGDDYAKRTERIKNLLSSYYGVDGADSPTSVQSENEPQKSLPSLHKSSYGPSATGIDSPAFNPDKHIAQILRSYNMERLMTEHSNMSREIKNLDSDMQQLVYENYNKFIAATDTIRTMKTNVDSMGTDMEKLKTMIEAVSSKSTVVNQKLKRRQDDMEELGKVQQLLKKLQAVFDLPKRMKAALEEDALETAVSFYAEALPLLQKYGSRGAFKVVAQEADAVARDISGMLKRRLLDRKDDTEQCVLLLRRMGEPDDTLQDKYLQGRAQRMKRILKEASVVVDIMAAAASGTPLPEAAIRKLESPGVWGFTDAASAPPLKQLIRVLDERIINAMRETAVNVATIFLQGDTTPVKRRPLIALTKDIFAEYFRVIKRAFADASAATVHKAARVKEAAEDEELAADGPALCFATDWGADTIAQGLAHITTDLGLLAGQLPELSLKDRCQEVVQGAVQHHMYVCFSALQDRVTSTLATARTRLSDSGRASGTAALPQAEQAAYLQKTFTYVSVVLQKGLAALLQGMKAYEGHPKLLASWHDTWADLVQGHLQHTFLALLHTFMEVTKIRYDGMDLIRDALKSQALAGDFAPTSDSLTLTRTSSQEDVPSTPTAPLSPLRGLPSMPGAPAAAAPAPEPPKSGMVLMLAKLCIYMEHQCVPYVMETIASSFAARGGGRGGDQPPAFVAGEVARKLGTASSILLSAYVELHGRQLSLMVRRSVAATNWLHHKEPRGPRPVCDLLLERVARAQQEVTQLASDSPSSSASTSGMGERGAGGAASSSRQPGKGKSPQHSRHASTAGGDSGLDSVNVERNVAKLFRDKVRIFGEVRFSASALLAAIIGVGLKSLVECVRLQTLGRAGLQQLQLDIHYLRPQLRRYAPGSTAATVDALLDEVITAGVERSVDPTLLEPTVLDRILSTSAAVP